jgi:tetratricopeptide (TPR) repeat protein
MNDIPFTLPTSLVSYAIQYESSPNKAIRRLENHLMKRGTDPIGYFLLGWFYHRKKQTQKAISCALKAKNYAPGSPFLRKLHYYFAHPNVFEAWRPYAQQSDLSDSVASFSGYESVEKLQILIEKLSTFDEVTMNNDKTIRPESDNILPSSSDDVDDIVSETLAGIHEEQGKPEAAIDIYKKLMKSNHSKSEDYKEEIERLKNKNDRS